MGSCPISKCPHFICASEDPASSGIPDLPPLWILAWDQEYVQTGKTAQCGAPPPRSNSPETYRSFARRDGPHDTCIRLSNVVLQYPQRRIPAGREPESSGADIAAVAMRGSAHRKRNPREFPLSAKADDVRCRSLPAVH